MSTRPFRAPASLVRLALLVLLLAGAVLAGCGSDAAPDASDSAAASSSAVAAFPTTVASEHGELIVQARPERIVSLSASLTEILFAIDAGSQVVAVDTSSDHPSGTPMTDLSGFRPNLEAVAGYEPDLVVVANDRDGIVAALAGLDIPTLLLSSPDDLEGVYDQIEVLGTATGHPVEAAALQRAMRDGLAPDGPVDDQAAPRRYYLELSATGHSVTSETFLGGVLSAAGLVSIADGVADASGGYPQLSTEFVLDADPDVVFVAYAGGEAPTAASVAARPGWDTMAAVRDGRVVVLDSDLASRWGPRLVDLLAAVREALDGPS
jgi:iron complex transport system substrate-binding protein